MESKDLWETLGVMAAIGVIMAVGKLLVSDEKFSWRIAIGRSIVSAGLAVAAGSVLAFLPAVSPLAVIGLATAVSVLGEQFLEKLIHEKVTGQA